MRPTGQCRSCHAPITWTKTSAGRSMPVDPEPVMNGNVVIDEHRGDSITVVVFSTPNDVPSRFPLRYRSHFVTCPNADEHRRDR